MIDTLLAMSVIPMAIFGGVLGLLISGIPFSVSAAIGFIALFGIAVMDGIIILSQYNQLIAEGFDRVRAVIRTGELQLRPVLMTCVIAGVGLLPAAMSAGIGSQVQKPLAVVVVTGMLLAPLVILVTLPVLISFFSRRGRGGAPGVFRWRRENGVNPRKLVLSALIQIPPKRPRWHWPQPCARLPL